MLEIMKNLLFKHFFNILRFSKISCKFRLILKRFTPDSDSSLIDVDETGHKTLHENSLNMIRKFD